MSLNIMIAGCAKDERDRIEQSVRAAFRERASDEPWNVSLVNIANQWSIDIDGPEPSYKGLSLVVTDEELTTSLERVLAEARGGADSAAPANATAAPAGAPGERKERHACESCQASFDVFFTALSGEPEELCPVACPTCWHVNKVPIAEGAGATGDYRAEAAG